MDKHQRHRLKDLEGYRKKKREYAKTPEQREKRKLYMQKWRDKNREHYNAWAREYARTHPDQKVWARRAYLKRQFGLTPEDYDRMLQDQDGGCAICGNPPTKRRLHIDHCHQTGAVRGLLCSRCNTSLGWFENHGEQAMTYLREIVW